MIITLTGENSFALQAALGKLVDDFVAIHGELALERLDGQEIEYDRVRESLQSLPFLASQKMVVLREASTNKQFVENFEQLFTDLPATTGLLLVEPKLDKRLSYYKYLKSKTDFREFPGLDQQGLSRWLVAAATERGAQLNPRDAQYLVERVGTDQQLLSNELDKLLLYDATISRQTIDVLTEPNMQSTIFQLLEAAFAGQSKRVLQLYGEQRMQKVEPAQIIALLAWQLHVLAVVKTAGDRSSDQIAREAKLNPFVVSKSLGIARNLTLQDLKSKISDLLQIDVRSKRTNLDADEALQHYLLTLTA
ncbi:MAG TPA: DNA polymerase III subunit delta [Candidatus Saccharimonadales bacterium]|nr:DNA polymerase III subunit delta [Candidatus Saccharimonadales bacterium]